MSTSKLNSTVKLNNKSRLFKKVKYKLICLQFFPCQTVPPLPQLNKKYKKYFKVVLKYKFYINCHIYMPHIIHHRLKYKEKER